MPNNELEWHWRPENRVMARAETAAVCVLTPVGTPVLQVLWPTATKEQTGGKTSFQC